MTTVRSRRWFGVLLVCLAVGAEAQPPAKTATVPETTTVEGKVPEDLVGRWFTVNSPKLPSGQMLHVGRLWEIRRGERLELVLHRRQLPLAVTQKLQQVSTAGKAWAPEPTDLAEIAQQWDQLPPDDTSYESIAHKLIGADAYSAEQKADTIVAGSDFVMLIQETFGGAQAVRNTYSVYAVRQSDAAGIAGTSVTTSLVVAIIPVPITHKGEFRSYRLDAGSPGMIARLLGWFSGCGR
jgi:hypothetical protein